MDTKEFYSVNNLVNSLYTIDERRDVLSVFRGFVDYMIGFFDADKKPVEGWDFPEECNSKFYELMCKYFQFINEKVKIHGWYDGLGDIFMQSVGKFSAQYKGQFFTPQDVCSMMAKCTISDTEPEPHYRYSGFGKRVSISDTACGSSRTLLAAHALFLENKWRQPILFGEDIDALCCKMSAVNLCIHGCFGEVVCHDTLMHPDEALLVYRINEGLYPFPGLPTIRRIQPEKSLILNLWNIKKQKSLKECGNQNEKCQKQTAKYSEKCRNQCENIPQQDKNEASNEAKKASKGANQEHKHEQLSIF
jgi:type I restriction enzyme M protein